jgi:hypothetical protein
MTKEEVLELSYAATDLHAFANMIEERVRRQEREACADLCDVLAVHPEYALMIGKELKKGALVAKKARGQE